MNQSHSIFLLIPSIILPSDVGAQPRTALFIQSLLPNILGSILFDYPPPLPPSPSQACNHPRHKMHFKQTSSENEPFDTEPSPKT